PGAGDAHRRPACRSTLIRTQAHHPSPAENYCNRARRKPTKRAAQRMKHLCNRRNRDAIFDLAIDQERSTHMPPQTKPNPRRYSSEVVVGLKQTPSRAMLRAVGYKDAAFTAPAIGIASTWSNLTPCNVYIDKLAKAAADSVDRSGGKSTTFGTITVSDGISNGAPGMRYSLVSREVIADSIETVTGAQGFDGVVAIGGCDKNMPGCMIALARLDRPAIFVYGGTIRPGPKHRDIISVFEARGAFASGQISARQLKEIERTAIPGPGSCAGMYTANTMASAIEAMGMSLPNSSAQNAVSKQKIQDCRNAGKAVVKLVKAGITPSQILTREAFENAITVVIALSGSTNAV